MSVQSDAAKQCYGYEYDVLSQICKLHASVVTENSREANSKVDAGVVIASPSAVLRSTPSNFDSNSVDLMVTSSPLPPYAKYKFSHFWYASFFLLVLFETKLC